jgi:Polysaccharide deacetylase
MMKTARVLNPKQHKGFCFVWLMLIAMVSLPCLAKLPLDTVLKTAFPEDPYANDGLSFRVLCYHDARDNLRESFQTWPERGALETSTLVEQFEWLRENGYHVVSLDDILAARNGGAKLPSKPVLLTFDDGYLSMYTRIFPLLKLFNYPAVIGLVGEWLEESKEAKALRIRIACIRAQLATRKAVCLRQRSREFTIRKPGIMKAMWNIWHDYALILPKIPR